MTILLPSLYNQMDSRWANHLLGFNTIQPYNFYNYACLITCLAMIARYFGKAYDPVKVNDSFKSMGVNKGFVPGGGDYIWGGFHLLFGDLEEERHLTPSALTDSQMGLIKSSLDAGYPVMVQLDYNPKDVDLDSHFVLLIGYNPADENDFTIADPIGGRVHSLKDYLGWFRPSARSTIEQFIIYRGPVPTVNTGCLVPNTAAWAATYKNIVHGSGEWDKTVAEYKPNTDPKQIAFEDVRSVVLGYKSRSTDLENKLTQAKAEKDAALTELANQKDKLANVGADQQKMIGLQKAQIDALIAGAKSWTDVEGKYQGTIEELQSDLRAAQVEGGQKDSQITVLKSQLEAAKKNQTISTDSKNALQKLLDQLATLLR
jgi:hypothetical protein